VSLFASPWAQLGAVAVVGVFVVAILTGRLVARSTAKALVDQANINAARWQQAAEASDRRADETVRLLGELVSAMRSVESLVRESPSRQASR
jgi:hypothetical protein